MQQITMSALMVLATKMALLGKMLLILRHGTTQ